MNWKLESFKIAGYLAFPVICFVIFNHPYFYESALDENYKKISESIDFETFRELKQKKAEDDAKKLKDYISNLEKD